MQNKKILVLNQGATQNYGDIAINNTIITYLKKQGFEVDYFPFWLEELVFGKKYEKIPKFIMKVIWHLQFLLDGLLKKTIRKNIVILKYDAIIIGGGELLCGHRGFNTALYIWTKLSEKYNIPIYILGVSGNESMPKKLVSRNKKSLHRCTKIIVRDTYTYKLCRNLYNVKCEHKPDVVFAYKKVCMQSLLKKEKRNTIICVPISYEILKNKLKFEKEEDYFIYLSNLITNKLKLNDRIIITSSVYSDNDFSKKFYRWMKGQFKQKEIYFEEYSSLENYIKLLNKAHTVISARMHALILGIIYGCNIVVIPFKEKLQVFQEEYSQEINVGKIEKDAIESLEIISSVIKNKKNLQEN